MPGFILINSITFTITTIITISVNCIVFRLRKMQEDMEKRGNELRDAMLTIEKLQKQLEETQVRIG